MATENYLIGFSEALDWRPMQFVNLPPLRSCSLCNVISGLTLMLECSHAVCELCYQRIIGANGRCPLDDQTFQESDVVKLPLKESQVDKFNVRCPNSVLGCDFVGSVPQARPHLLRECDFHAVTCSGCNAKVLRRNIVNHHLERQCEREPPASATQRWSGDVFEIGRQVNSCLDSLAEKMCAFEDQLNTHTVAIGEMRACLATKGDLLHGLFLDVRDRVMAQTADEAVSVQLLNANRDAVESLAQDMDMVKRCSQEVVDFVNADSEGREAKPIAKAIFESSKILSTLGDFFGDTFRYVQMQCKEVFTEIQGFAQLLNVAEILLDTTRYSNTVVLCGYSVQIGVCLGRMPRSPMIFGILVRICRGSNDRYLKWPFRIPCTLSVLHPTDDAKNITRQVDVIKLVTSTRCPFTRPTTVSNNGWGIRTLCSVTELVEASPTHMMLHFIRRIWWKVLTMKMMNSAALQGPIIQDLYTSTPHMCMSPPFWEEGERLFLVGQSSLRELLSEFLCCGVSELTTTIKPRGTWVQARTTCSCDRKRSWSSQHWVGSRPLGNMLLCTSILFSGVNVTKALRTFEMLRAPALSKSQYYRTQKEYPSRCQLY
ncbi:uncharacterized protein LOC135378687 isoform X2 [Ornithodoros turicata]|uniref:uncharacterized protein LOC135378687 isoform X2 n=1 Tax=Ornithodoros turicata TaxID=34597 RepID=UPI003139BC7C